MSLFKKAGEKFEETKQSFMSGRETDYVCCACEEPVDEEYDHCPHCGEPAVEPID